MRTWPLIVVLAIGTVLMKTLGPVLAGGRQPPAPLTRVIALVAPALISALIVTGTFTQGQQLIIDARAAGVRRRRRRAVVPRARCSCDAHRSYRLRGPAPRHLTWLASSQELCRGSSGVKVRLSRLPGYALVASFRYAISSDVNVNDRAPALCVACSAFFAPGIGTTFCCWSSHRSAT